MWTVVALLLVAAGLLWGSSRLDWLHPTYDTPLRGRVVVEVTGAAWQPALVPLAVLALAGMAAALATAGVARRLVGGLLAVAGVWAVVLAAGAGLLGPPAVAGLPDAPAGGRLVAVAVLPSGPLLAGPAGLALALAGGLLVLREAALPRLGARYSAPGQRRRTRSPDRGMWDALDAGLDPTDENRT